ncbi:MAG: hypothetical protein JKY67_12430 [Pseudomonadales bacterium]|nr:hypothetical protein [Pseudomonadales bacterium]
MNPLAILGGLVLLAIIAVIGSSIANQRYIESSVKKRNLKSLKYRALQLQEILEGLARTTCNMDVRQALSECMIDTLRDIKDTDPQHPGIDVVMEATRQLLSLPPKSLIEHDGPAESDSEIKKLQGFILAAIALVRKLPEMGRITHADCQEWVLHLHMLYVQVEVDAHIMQGNKALSLGDKGDASTHFRVAQTKLVQSKYHGESKKKEIAKIGDMIRSVFH